jgi:hypothetical protein
MLKCLKKNLSVKEHLEYFNSKKVKENKDILITKENIRKKNIIISDEFLVINLSIFKEYFKLYPDTWIDRQYLYIQGINGKIIIKDSFNEKIEVNSKYIVKNNFKQDFLLQIDNVIFNNSCLNYKTINNFSKLFINKNNYCIELKRKNMFFFISLK